MNPVPVLASTVLGPCVLVFLLPWLPGGGATALGGGATELMSDIIIVVLPRVLAWWRGKVQESGRAAELMEGAVWRKTG